MTLLGIIATSAAALAVFVVSQWCVAKIYRAGIEEGRERERKEKP
jgi:hypothetical protein